MRILGNTNFNFIRWRWHALILSIGLIWAGVATMYVRGLALGIDFSGGTAVVLRFPQDVTVDTIRDGLGSIGSEAVVQRYGEPGSHEIMVRLPLSDATGQQDVTGESTRVEDALRASDVGAFEVVSKEVVGPVVGNDLRRKGIFATLTALGGILVYLGFRFRFSFAFGAIVATFHDLLITLVFLSWFGYEMSLNVVAAILAIAGYSVNDTIVVFDRVRENQRLMRREPLDEIINKSVNDTMSRTLITSGTTFLAVLALFLFGGEVLRGFAFTMLVGIITGTYSTIFIASAIAIIVSRRPQARTVAAAGAPAGKAKSPDARSKRRARG